MARFGLTRRRIAIVALPAAALVAAGAGVAVAASNGSGGAEANDRPTYHSSLTTTPNDDNGNETTQHQELAKIAKIGPPQAAQAASQGVPGGTVIEVELGNEGGNVVYTARVVTPQGEFEAVIDAGNGNVLAKNAANDNEKGDQASSDSPEPGTAATTGDPANTVPSHP